MLRETVTSRASSLRSCRESNSGSIADSDTRETSIQPQHQQHRSPVHTRGYHIDVATCTLFALRHRRYTSAVNSTLDVGLVRHSSHCIELYTARRSAACDSGCGPGFDLRHVLQHPAIVVGHDLHEPAKLVVPIVEDLLGDGAAGELHMVFQQVADGLRRLPACRGFPARPCRWLHKLRQLAQVVVDVGDAAAHAGGEVAAGAADDDDAAAGHVFAAMIAAAFDDGFRAGVADAEAFADDAADVDLAVDRAVADDVAGDDVLLGAEGRVLGREDGDAPAGQAFADVVVGVAFQQQRDAAGEEAAEALAGRAGELEGDRVVGQAGLAVLLGDFARERGADGAIGVLDRKLGGNLFAALERRLRQRNQLACCPAIVPGHDPASARCEWRRPAARGLIENRRQVQMLGLPVIATHPANSSMIASGRPSPRTCGMPMLRHELAHFLGDEEHEVDDVLGLAGEFLAQLRVLRGDADRAGVQMADAHHDAAGGDQRRRWRSRIPRRRAARR